MARQRRIVAGMALIGAFMIWGGGQAYGALDLYAESNYRAKIGSFSSAMTNHRNMSTNANDTLTSFKNNTPFSVAFWHDANKGGRCFTAAPGDVNHALGFWDDNKVSSFQLGRAC